MLPQTAAATGTTDGIGCSPQLLARAAVTIGKGVATAEARAKEAAMAMARANAEELAPRSLIT
jgi:hypothetical protein